MMDKLDQTLADIVQKMADLSVQYGPDAGELLLATVRFDGISTLAIGCAALFLALCLFALALYAGPRLDPHRPNGMEGVFIIACVAGVVAGVTACVHLGDRWAWAAAIDPRLFLAHEILQKIGM